ncbi:MAG: MFS transporter, partial [Halieaceae bacterium]|nr:MFS transporter [Halieaceae bacterium]
TQAAALLLLAFNLLGMGLGPLLVGLLSDTLAASHAENSIRYALLYSLVTVVVGATLYLLGNRHYVAHIRQAD